MLLEFNYRNKRNNKLSLAIMKEYARLFVKRNLFELVLATIMSVVMTIFIVLIVGRLKNDYQVGCRVSQFTNENVTSIINTGVGRNLLTIENGTVSESNSDSESHSESHSYYNYTGLDDEILEPYWFFNYYCVFSRIDSDGATTLKKTAVTLVGENVLYSQKDYYYSTFAVGTDHTCHYRVKSNTLVYNSIAEFAAPKQDIEIIILAFCALVWFFCLYFIWDKERGVDYYEMITRIDSTSRYIQEFNNLGNFDTYSNNSSSDDDQGDIQIHLIPYN